MDRIEELKGIINRVSFAVCAVRHGVVITIEPDNGIYSFVIWKIKNGQMRKVVLLASVTTEDRLKAHAEGFIANTADDSEDDYHDDRPREPLIFLPHPLETDYPL